MKHNRNEIYNIVSQHRLAIKNGNRRNTLLSYKKNLINQPLQ